MGFENPEYVPSLRTEAGRVEDKEGGGCGLRKGGGGIRAVELKEKTAPTKELKEGKKAHGHGPRSRCRQTITQASGRERHGTGTGSGRLSV